LNGRSFDYLVCSVKNRLRNRNPDLLCGFEIDYELELAGLL